ncbi:MAG: glycosyltransferase family 39 protein [bacterium]
MKTIKNIFKNEQIFLIILLTVAFIIRLLYVIFISTLQAPPTGDGVDYDMIGMNIINGYGYSLYPGVPTSYRPPLYQFFLAGIYFCFGHSYAVVRIIQSLIGALTCLITYFMGKELFNKNIGMLSSLLLVFYPSAIYFCGQIYTEGIFIFLLTISMFYAIKVYKKPSLKNQIICGILIGLSILTRPILLPFLPFIFIWCILIFKQKKVAIMNFSIITLFILLTLSPWTIRNYIVHHRFVPIATLGGPSFFVCNNPFEKNGIWYMPNEAEWRQMGEKPPNMATRPPSPYISTDFGAPLWWWKDLSEVENEKKHYRLAINWIKNHPQEFIKLCGKKLIRFWEWETQSAAPIAQKYKLINLLSYAILLPFMVIGLFFSFKEFKKFAIIYLLILQFTLNTILFYGSTRFRTPLDPYLLIFASIGIYRLYWIFQPSRK